jgi:putative transposase
LVYLAAIIDIFSRKIVGYAIGETLSFELTPAALKMALTIEEVNGLIYYFERNDSLDCKFVI